MSDRIPPVDPLGERAAPRDPAAAAATGGEPPVAAPAGTPVPASPAVTGAPLIDESLGLPVLPPATDARAGGPPQHWSAQWPSHAVPVVAQADPAAGCVVNDPAVSPGNPPGTDAADSAAAAHDAAYNRPLAPDPFMGAAGPSSHDAGESANPAYLKQSDSAWSVLGRSVAARARAIFDRAGQRITQRTLRIGVSARIFHPEPDGKGLRGKTLQYLEESIAHWVMSRDVLVFMVPTVGQQGMLHPSNIRLRDYARHLDGLVLQGGADVSPQSYADVATRPEWPGDRVRDMYELELLHEFVESGKPVLGICRGCQLINVAFGGTLYQDIVTDVPEAHEHVTEQYDQHRHPIRFPPGSTLGGIFAGQGNALVNSIHHQAVKTVGRDLSIEAVSADDGIIEAVRYRRAPFVMGVQWHPEFHRAGGEELLDCTPLLDNFLRVARETRF
jgi:putative glutamine amidotransferase